MGIVLPLVSAIGIYKLVTKEVDPISKIVLSYDEQDDFDLKTVVAIMDT